MKDPRGTEVVVGGCGRLEHHIKARWVAMSSALAGGARQHGVASCQQQPLVAQHGPGTPGWPKHEEELTCHNPLILLGADSTTCPMASPPPPPPPPPIPPNAPPQPSHTDRDPGLLPGHFDGGHHHKRAAVAGLTIGFRIGWQSGRQGLRSPRGMRRDGGDVPHCGGCPKGRSAPKR